MTNELYPPLEPGDPRIWHTCPHFFTPQMRYTIAEAYDWIEENAPARFDTPQDTEEFQQKVNERFPMREPGEL